MAILYFSIFYLFVRSRSNGIALNKVNYKKNKNGVPQRDNTKNNITKNSEKMRK